MKSQNDNYFFDIPKGKEVVYNDNMYYFTLSSTSDIPSKLYINDEAYDIGACIAGNDGISFKLKDCNDNRPFLNCFGAVKIEMELAGQSYYSSSMAVMISNTGINNSILNMVNFIYKHCEEYLYEEHKNSVNSTGIKENQIRSLEAKVAFLQKSVLVYKQSYQYLKTNPYAKLQKTESVDSFNKLQSVSQRTIHHIVNHIDELTPVNYDTGIRFNNQFYQPNKILVEFNSYSHDVYENRIIIGFLKTIVFDINDEIKRLEERIYFPQKTQTVAGYVNSMYQIFSRSIKKLSDIITQLKSLQSQYQELYYFYSRLLGINADTVRTIPIFTAVFRSINAYRQIYEIIHAWFHIGNYDLKKDELVLSFISTSQIYEYFCLIKLLHYISQNMKMNLSSSKHVSYNVKNRYYTDTKYNNTFVFNSKDMKLTLFFQPVIYGDNSAINDIYLFRNTSSNSKQDVYNRGYIYTPDYIIKLEKNSRTDYIILDAKFSTSSNIRIHQLQELVYKYIFSVSVLKPNDTIQGLYILCGKSSQNDTQDIVHDLANKINHKVMPFAEILCVGGISVDDYGVFDIIFKS